MSSNIWEKYNLDKDSILNNDSNIWDKYNLDKAGYRLITNEGMDSNQEVLHFHVHILGGNNLGGLIK